MDNTMDKLRELSERWRNAAETWAVKCKDTRATYHACADELDAILHGSEAPVPVAATLDDAAADPALTLDVARELLRDAAAGIRRLAAKPAEGREECPWGGCGDCVGHEATQPAGDGGDAGAVEALITDLVDEAYQEGKQGRPAWGQRLTDIKDDLICRLAASATPRTEPAEGREAVADGHDMERKARELLAAEYERRGSRRMAEVIRNTPAAEFGDRDFGCALRAVIGALVAREGGAS